MPLYQITVKVTKQTSGQRIERGMSVQVVTNSMANPVITDKAAVARAFASIYGVDLQVVGVLSTAYLDAVRIG